MSLLITSHLILSKVPFGRVLLAPVDPELFWLIPQDKVSKVKETTEPEDSIELVAGANVPLTTLVTNKLVPPY